MAFWQRLFGGDPELTRDRDMWGARAWGGSSYVSTSGQIVTAETTLSLDAVQGCLEALGGSVSTISFKLFERGENGARREATEHPLYRVLHDRPNASQTAQEFRDEQQRHLAYYRNCYALILSDGSAPVTGLLPIHPSRVSRIERDGDGTVWYEVRGLGTGATERIRGDMMWHLRKAPLTVDGLAGRPVFETARETIGRALAVEDYGSLWFNNSGLSGGVLKHPGGFKSVEDREAFLENWRAGRRGPNAHSDRLLTHGVDYVPYSVKNNEAQFLETMKHNELKICRIWQMPPHRAGILEESQYANIEQQSIDYVMYTLAPYISAWEQGVSRDLLVGQERERYFAEFNVSSLLRGDIAARYAAYAVARQWGWLSVNDIRKLENQMPVTGGDEYLRPLNMSPVGAGGQNAP